MQIKLRLLIAATLFVLFSSTARALDHTQIATYGGVVNFSNVFAAPSIVKFDPSWGTLLSVSIEFDTLVKNHTTSTLQAAANPPVSAIAGSAGTIILRNPGIPSLGQPMLTLNTSVLSDPVFLNVGQTTNFGGPLSSNDSDAAILTAPADLSFFTGLGTVDFAVDATVLTSVINSGSGSATLVNTFNNTANGAIKVTYNYRPAERLPEPGTLVLLLGGAMAWGIFRKRHTA